MVTYHEYTAFRSLDGDECYPVDNAMVEISGDPFANDSKYHDLLINQEGVKLVHAYSGCWSKTFKMLKNKGAKLSITIAAHSIPESKVAFEDLGFRYDFPHLTDPVLWEQYSEGLRLADLVICPSTLSKRIMEGYGCKNVTVIPHGCEIPRAVAPFPKRFVLGFLGSAGPDKGVRHLFEAWKSLNLKDGLLLIAGNNVDQTLPLWRRFGGGNVEFMGFVKDVSDFYNRITVYCQSSSSEGFGIEILEAMAHGRPVICSTGAGAADVVAEGTGVKVPPRAPARIAEAIGLYRASREKADSDGAHARENAKAFEWEKIREHYQALWKPLL